MYDSETSTSSEDYCLKHQAKSKKCRTLLSLNDKISSFKLRNKEVPEEYLDLQKKLNYIKDLKKIFQATFDLSYNKNKYINKIKDDCLIENIKYIIFICELLIIHYKCIEIYSDIFETNIYDKDAKDLKYVIEDCNNYIKKVTV